MVRPADGHEEYRKMTSDEVAALKATEQTNEERAAWTCALETGNYIHPDELKEFMDKKKGTSCP